MKNEDKDKSSSSQRFIVISSILAIGFLVFLIFIAYRLVDEGKELADFQAFVLVMISAVSSAVVTLILKLTADKFKQDKFKQEAQDKMLESQRNHQQKMMESQREHQEKMMESQRNHDIQLETIRLQTNGRLHERDDQIKKLNTFVVMLMGMITRMKEETGTDLSDINTPETSAVMEALHADIIAGQEKLKSLKPFSDQDGNQVQQ